ncbi:MAG: hypothetical protein FWG64_10215 [Firmicutes bacterium]|nr:hypothetical protein [Bacillota bacterium]
MDWESDLVKRSFLVLDSLACEIFFSEEIGRVAILITDCLDTSQKALYVKNTNSFFQKLSTFKSITRQSDLAILVHNNSRLFSEKIAVI